MADRLLFHPFLIWADGHISTGRDYMPAPGKAPNYTREMRKLILVTHIRAPCFPLDWAVDSVAAVEADTNISAYANP
jgi:hypothetical protein